jgi:hypothetical protein
MIDGLTGKGLHDLAMQHDDDIGSAIPYGAPHVVFALRDSQMPTVSGRDWQVDIVNDSELAVPYFD